MTDALTEVQHPLHGVVGEKRIDEDLGRFLANSIHASGSLNQTDYRPGEVVHTHDVGILEVLAL